jgi:hypothetical protein
MCGENQNKVFKFNIYFSENRAVYEIMWKNRVVLDATDKIMEHA